MNHTEKPNGPVTEGALRSVEPRNLIAELEKRLVQVEEALRVAEEKYRQIVDTTSEGFLLLGPDCVILEANDSVLGILGYKRDQVLGKKPEDFWDESTRDFHFANRRHLSFEVSFLAREGRTTHVLFNRSAIFGTEGETTGFVCFLTDLTELNAAREEVRRAEIKYRTMYEDAVQGMFRSTIDGRLIDVNPSYARIMGCESTEAMLSVSGNAETFYHDPEDRAGLVDALKKDGMVSNYELKMKRIDGRSVWVIVNGRLTTEPEGLEVIEGIVTDNTDRKAMEQELRRSEENYRWMAVHDDLTGLYNTRHLYLALDDHLKYCRESDTPLSLIFMDLDRFKNVVDTHGHLNGSRVIAEVADTVAKCLKEPAFGVAYGGDEFVVVLPGLDRDEALKKAEQIRERMSRTTYLTGRGLSVKLTASLGVASFPEDASDLNGLLGLADQALFRVKETGRGAVGTIRSGGSDGISEAKGVD